MGWVKMYQKLFSIEFSIPLPGDPTPNPCGSAHRPEENLVPRRQAFSCLIGPKKLSGERERGEDQESINEQRGDNCRSVVSPNYRTAYGASVSNFILGGK